MSMRRPVLAIALLLGLLGMHGLASGHMTMTAAPMASMASMASAQHAAAPDVARGAVARVADAAMHHDVCVAVQRETGHPSGPPAGPATSPAATTTAGHAVVTTARIGRAPPHVDLDRLCISRT